MLVFMNTNNANMPNQSRMQQLQMQQALLSEQQNQFQQQINAQMHAASNGNADHNTSANMNATEHGALQTTNRANNNKRVLKLRKELSGVSSGFNQSRSASQGRAALLGAGQGSTQALNQLVGDSHKSKSHFTQNGLQFEMDGSRNSGLAHMRTSKGHDAYNSKQSLPGQGSHDGHSQLSGQSANKNTRNAM